MKYILTIPKVLCSRSCHFVPNINITLPSGQLSIVLSPTRGCVALSALNINDEIQKS
jgi:hypothetical protein